MKLHYKTINKICLAFNIIDHNRLIWAKTALYDLERLRGAREPFSLLSAPALYEDKNAFRGGRKEKKGGYRSTTGVARFNTLSAST